MISSNLKYRTLCINLLKRPDRKAKMTELFNKNKITNYEFYEAVDGLKLAPSEYIKNLFVCHDHGYRKGFIGCALSHYNIWKELSKDTVHDFYLIFEDDLRFCDNYITKLEQVFQKMDTKIHEMIYLGYCMEPSDRLLYSGDENNVTLEYLNRNIYVGGFYNYIITKTAALKILKYINVYGIKHGIDYVVKLVPDLCMFETHPLFIFSDWVRSLDGDSNIQNNFDCFNFDMNYTYYHGLDSGGNDITFVDRKSIPELKKLCESTPNCIGFNTLGFLKRHVNELGPSPYFGPDDGLYVYNERAFEFYPGLDSPGNDIDSVWEKPIKDLMVLAGNNPNCVGFNSLGFLKHTIEKLQPLSNSNSETDGLYIHKFHNLKRFKIRVKMICNWKSSQQLCEEFEHMTKGDCRWNKLQITWEDTNIDYYVILNKPMDEYNIHNNYYEPSRTIVFQLEPWCPNPEQNWGVKTWGEWAEPSPEKFNHVRTHKTHINAAFWLLKATYNELKNNPIIKQKNKISSICSSKYFDPGHIKRINFLKFVESKQDPTVMIDIYNYDNIHNFKNYMGPHPPNFKDVGIIPYKYYFMAENNQEKNFITEKIWESLLTDTLCFYWGCPNIADWIDPRAYVWLDLDDFETSFNIMKHALENDLWSKRIAIIREEKQKVLEYYGLFPTIERIINLDPVPALTKKIYRENFGNIDIDNKIVCFIHSCNLGSISILDTLIEHIINSNLVKVLDKIYIINVGQPIPKEYEKSKIIQYASETNTHELETINIIYQFSEMYPNVKLLYLHTKGITYPNVQIVMDWVDHMLYYLVDKYERYLGDKIQMLDKWDAVGVNWLNWPGNHFSGNFWWSNTNHLRKLTPITSGVRHDAEWWVLSHPDTKFYELHNSGVHHYEMAYPPNLYQFGSE